MLSQIVDWMGLDLLKRHWCDAASVVQPCQAERNHLLQLFVLELYSAHNWLALLGVGHPTDAHSVCCG